MCTLSTSVFTCVPEIAWPFHRGQRSGGHNPCSRAGQAPVAHTAPSAAAAATPPPPTGPIIKKHSGIR